MSKGKNLMNEGIRYLVAGVLTTLVNLLIYQLLLWVGISYLPSTTIAFICAVIFAFGSNRRFVFRVTGTDRLTAEFFLFAGSRLTTFLVETAGLILMIEGFSTGEMTAKVIMNVIVIVLNYLISKFWVFNGKESERQEEINKEEQTMKKWTWEEREWKPLLTLVAFLIVGAVLRIWFITQIPTEQQFDFETYQQLAVNIATGQGYTLGGYPVAWQGMLYSTGLGVLYKLMGSTSELIPKGLNVLMSEMTILWVYLILKKIYNRPWAVWMAVAWMTFMPHQIAYCNVVGTEIITAFLLGGTIWVSLLEIKARYKFPALGVLSALLALSKPFFLAYPLVLGVAEYLMSHNWKRSIALFGSSYLIMTLVILPWSLRNLEKYDRWVQISYNSGFNLYINNNAQNVHGGWMDYHQIEKPEALEKAIEAEVAAHGDSVKTSPNLEVLLKPYAMTYIKSHPLEFFKLGVIRIHSTYFNGAWDLDAWTMNGLKYEDSESGLDEFAYSRLMNFYRSVSDISLAIISGFGIVFVFMNIWRFIRSLFSRRGDLKPHIVIPVINLAFISLVFFVYEGQPRYNFIVLFLLIMAFAIGFDILRDNFKESEGKAFKSGV